MATSGAHIAAAQIVFHRRNLIAFSVKPPVIVAFRVARTGLSDKIPRLQRPETHGGTALAHPRPRSLSRSPPPPGGARPLPAPPPGPTASPSPPRRRPGGRALSPV